MTINKTRKEAECIYTWKGDDKKTPNGSYLGGGNSDIFGIFTPKIGEDEPNLTFAYFSDGLVQPPTSYFLKRPTSKSTQKIEGDAVVWTLEGGMCIVLVLKVLGVNNGDV